MTDAIALFCDRCNATFRVSDAQLSHTLEGHAYICALRKDYLAYEYFVHNRPDAVNYSVATILDRTDVWSLCHFRITTQTTQTPIKLTDLSKLHVSAVLRWRANSRMHYLDVGGDVLWRNRWYTCPSQVIKYPENFVRQGELRSLTVALADIVQGNALRGMRGPDVSHFLYGER